MHKVLLTTIGILMLIFLVASIAFIIVNLIPGDPFSSMGGLQPLSPKEVKKLKALYGLDKPLIERYIMS